MTDDAEGTPSRNEPTPAPEDEALASAIAHLRPLGDAFADGFYIVDTDARIRFVNRVIRERSGITEADYGRLNYLDLVQAGDREASRRRFERVMAGQTVGPNELRCRTPEGDTGVYEFLAAPIRDGGRVIGLLGISRDITARRRAEAALRQRERFLQTVFDNIQDGITVRDRDLTLIRVNRWIEQMFADRMPLVGKKCYRAFQGRDAPCPWCPAIPAMETGRVHSRVVPYPCEEEAAGRFEITAFPMTDDDGEIVGAVEHVRDVTDRWHAAEALRESEETYRALVEASPDAVVAADLEQRLITASDRAYEMFGYEKGDAVLGRNITGFFRPQDVPRLEENFRRTLREGLTRNIAYTLVRKDGSAFVGEICAAALRTPDGKVQGVIATVRDITERRRAEKALRESEARYRAVVELQTELVCRYTTDGVLTFANDAYCRYFGKDREELLGRPFAPLIIEEDRERIRRELEAVSSENPVVTVEERVRRGDGRLRWQQWTNRGIFDEQGNLREVLGVGRDVTDRKLAEEALRQSEENYRAIFNAVHDMVFVHDIETGDVIDMNRRACETYGYGPDELDALNRLFRGRNDTPYAHADQQRWLRRAAEEGPQVFEWLATDRRGRPFWVEVGVRRARIGGTDRLLAVLRDISDRKQAERQARLLSTAVEQSTEGIAVSDVDGNLLFVNEAFATMHGYAADELVGKHLSVFHAPDQLPAVEAANRRIRAEGGFSGEIWHRRRDGSLFPTYMHNSLLQDEAGNPVGMVAAMRDITDRKRAEEALRKSEEDYRLLFEQSVDGIVIVADGRIVRANRAFADIHARAVDDLIGTPSTDLIHPDERAIAAERIRGIADGTLERPGSRQYHALRADGSTALVEYRSRRILWEGRPAVQAIVRDITEQARMEEQLQQALKMEAVGQLAGGIAHDFNNLMTGILCHAGLLKSEDAPRETVRETADLIEGAARRAAELTSQLLGFARRGKQRDVPLDLVGTVEMAVRLLGRSLPAAIHVRTDYRLPQAYVRGDPVQMEQVVLNLAMNARDAMPDGGTVTFAVEQRPVDRDTCSAYPHADPGPYTVLSVSDTGTGIPKEQQPRVFEPFFTTKPQGKGTGMGLAMVYGIVRNHGGWIGVESEPGQGTTFRVYLPAVEPPPDDHPPATETAPEDAAPVEGRILLVDDEELVRDVVPRMLARFGYEAVAVAGGHEAVEHYRRAPGDVALVIIDLRMPGMDGRECFRALKQIDPDVRAILATGAGTAETFQDLLDEGLAGLIQKPFEANDLRAAVRRALPA